ncbi:MAG TPA: DegV family protein [Ktedonobacteraceae bacterium]|jgi:DegV family protein with EDD domain
MISIVTDSTADIPIPQAEELGITIVPLTVFFGDKSYLDDIELDNAQFYTMLQNSKELPRTSQPSPAAFQEAYTRLVKEGVDGILSVHLSGKLSGTYQSACTARDMLPDEIKKVPIDVIDSQSVSAGMGYAIQRAAQEARAGKDLEEIKAHLLNCLERTRILAVLDTLEWLRRGGRIGGARAFLGNMLSVKPVVSLKGGEVIPIEQPRTRSKAYARVAQLFNEMGPSEHISIVESNEEVGQQLAEALKTVYNKDIEHYKLGGVLGTHTGPGTVGACIVTEQ